MDKITLVIINSKFDSSGNRYWAFTAHNPDNGKTVSYYAPHTSGSNIEQAQWSLRGRWPETGESRWFVVFKELPIREFDRFVKNLPVFSKSSGEDVFNFIKDNIG